MIITLLYASQKHSCATVLYRVLYSLLLSDIIKEVRERYVRVLLRGEWRSREGSWSVQDYVGVGKKVKRAGRCKCMIVYRR